LAADYGILFHFILLQRTAFDFVGCYANCVPVKKSMVRVEFDVNFVVTGKGK